MLRRVGLELKKIAIGHRAWKVIGWSLKEIALMNNFTKATLSLIAVLMLPFSSWSSGYTTKIDSNGKTYVVENPGRFSDTITCGDLNASVTASELLGGKPDIMVLFISATGNDTVRPVPKRLISEFDNHLEDYHTILDFKVGCLSGDGGIGMIFQSSNPSMNASYVQLDKYGRLFSKFNQTGYVLQTVEP